MLGFWGLVFLGVRHRMGLLLVVLGVCGYGSWGPDFGPGVGAAVGPGVGSAVWPGLCLGVGPGVDPGVGQGEGPGVCVGVGPGVGRVRSVARHGAWCWISTRRGVWSGTRCGFWGWTSSEALGLDQVLVQV
jgi:hypothetical protein